MISINSNSLNKNTFRDISQPQYNTILAGESSGQLIPNMSREIGTTHKKILVDDVDGMSDPSDSCGSINSERDIIPKKSGMSKPVMKSPKRAYL